MGDELGQRIYESVCADCWEFWLRNLSIKVINEMRLDLSTERGQEIFYYKCWFCHNEFVQGIPRLDGLYQRGKLMSGESTTAAGMPFFTGLP